MEFVPIEQNRQTLGEKAYSSIRNAIITLRLKPGQMVYESKLAQSLGVSRTPIREAFRTLLTEELIEILPQRGARIAYISEKKVQETSFVRECLELSAFEEIAKKWDAQASAEAEQELLRLLDEQKHAASNGDAERFLQLDEAFHHKMLEQLDNDTLLDVVFHMRGHLNRMRYLALEQLKDMDRLIVEHEAILQAVTANQAAETVKLLKQHLTKLSEDLSFLKDKFPDYFKD